MNIKLLLSLECGQKVLSYDGKLSVSCFTLGDEVCGSFQACLIVYKIIYFLGSFTAQEIESISADQLDAVAGNSLRHIPPDIFKAFSLEQLSNMSGEQVAAMTDEQKSVLSSEQKAILMGIETAALGYTSGK